MVHKTNKGGYRKWLTHVVTVVVLARPPALAVAATGKFRVKPVITAREAELSNARHAMVPARSKTKKDIGGI